MTHLGTRSNPPQLSGFVMPLPGMLGHKVAHRGPALFASSGRRGECWEDRPHYCHRRDGRLPDLRHLVGQD